MLKRKLADQAEKLLLRIFNRRLQEFMGANTRASEEAIKRAAEVATAILVADIMARAEVEREESTPDRD